MTQDPAELKHIIARKKRMQKDKPADLSQIETRRVFRVELPQAGLRADKFLHQRNPWQSRTQLAAAFEEERVLRNNHPCPPGRKLQAGDEVVLLLPPPHEDVTEMQRIPFDVVLEDDVMLVVSKPPHLIVHPTGGYRYTTLLNAVHLRYRQQGGDPRHAPSLVNRIDKETSGLVLLGKTGKISGILGSALAEKDVVKDYLALVEGIVAADHQTIDLPLGADSDGEIGMLRRVDHEKGQPACTEVWVVVRLGRFSLVRCRLHTGRQHQIRVHMKAIGHPLVCDHHYGLRDELRGCDLGDAPPAPTRLASPYGYQDGDSDADVAERIRAVDTAKRHEYEALCRGEPVPRPDGDRLLLGRCALHSHYLKLAHPVSGAVLELTAPLPRDMAGALEALRAAGMNRSLSS
ncbi:MAG: RluA family pseudouridine synthase [Planctomycetes bacterium]|nr:RluA family pseudouridine synthase [Planctomycetota bacterium]